MKKLISIILSTCLCTAFIPTVMAETTNADMVYYDFTYEENFDSYENGATPSGFTPIDAKASAVVENGQLKITADEWWSQTGVLIDELVNVKREGLTVEMDMTLVSYADGAETDGAQPGASVMIKDDTGTGYYQMRAVKDPQWGSFLLVRDGLKLQANVGDEFTSNQKITLKLTFDGAGRTATGYVNGVQKRTPLTVSDHVDNTDAYICPAIDEGQLAIGGNGVVVLYDNIKITGKKLTPVSEIGDLKLDIEGETFESTEAAKAAAKVSFNAAGTDGYVDVTVDAEITAVAKSETECEITAVYNGLTVTATCTLIPMVYYDFTYEENFDSYENGATPAGFTPIDAKASAVVENGQLKVTADEWYSQTGILIDELVNVKREGLTVEMDMTLVSYADGAETDGAQPGASFIIKDDTGMGYYQMRAAKDPDWGSFLLVRDGLKLQSNVGDEFTSNQKITLKLTFDGAGRTATGYVNGVQKRIPLTVSDHVDNTDAYICPAIDEGQLAIGGNGVVTLFDNIRISGTRLMPRSETPNIKAMFDGGQTEFETIEEAKAAARVLYNDWQTVDTDVTADAEITAVMKSESEGEITVVYNGMIAVAGCTIKAKAYYDFIYEENFDTYADGALPAGFTISNSQNASAVIENGELVVTSTAWWPGINQSAGVLIDCLNNVKKEGLTIEADITRVSEVSDGYKSAGFMFVGKDTSGEKHVNLYGIHPHEQKLYYADGGKEKVFDITSPHASYEKTRLKLVFDNVNETPTLYVNGELQFSSENLWSELVNKGQIGLGGTRSTVKYDNIKITGKKGIDEAIAESEITVSSRKVENGNIAVSVDLMDAVSADANVYLAVYEKATEDLVAVSVREWNPAKYNIAKFNLELSGIEGYSEATHEIKVLVFEKETVRPIVNCVKF